MSKKSFRWRKYNAATDKQAVGAIGAAQAGRCGNMPGLVDMTKFPCVLPLVLEENGQILGALFFQYICELQLVSTDPMFAIQTFMLREQLKNSMRMRGIRFVMADVEPSALPVGRLLEDSGFEKLGPGFERFYLDLAKEGVNRA